MVGGVGIRYWNSLSTTNFGLKTRVDFWRITERAYLDISPKQTRFGPGMLIEFNFFSKNDLTVNLS